MAAGLNAGPALIDGLAASLAGAPRSFCDGLEELGWPTFRPAATYFVTTDVAAIGEPDALAFCRALPARCGVVAVPSSVFYLHPAEGASLVRWAFCKRPEVLADALVRLKALAA